MAWLSVSGQLAAPRAEAPVVLHGGHPTAVRRPLHGRRSQGVVKVNHVRLEGGFQIAQWPGDVRLVRGHRQPRNQVNPAWSCGRAILSADGQDLLVTPLGEGYDHAEKVPVGAAPVTGAVGEVENPHRWPLAWLEALGRPKGKLTR
jgi:hypothetical protein